MDEQALLLHGRWPSNQMDAALRVMLAQMERGMILT